MEADTSLGWLLEIREYWRRLAQEQNGGVPAAIRETTSGPEPSSMEPSADPDHTQDGCDGSNPHLDGCET